MISKQAVEDQLKRIGVNFRFWGRSEVNELGRILMEDEIIAQCVNGEYSNGFAMLVATNHRLLLVDKKPLLYLTVEDYRYEMITEFNFHNRLMNAMINIYTANKTMSFTSWNQHRLRKLLEYVQGRVLEMRQHQQLASQFSAAAAAQFAQAYAAQAQAQINGQALAAPATHQPLQSAERQPLPAPAQPVVATTTDTTSSAPAQRNDATQQPSAPGSLLDAPAKPHQSMGSRLSNGRAALGTYTRSKLPHFSRLSFRDQPQQPQQTAENGEILPEGYRPPGAIGRFGISYDFES